ncbi:MAG: DUF262 domain-containing protein [Oscillospiraceae bacterium]|nr:DUF262 domain-containing protein [Oscillospiraceae bacterium]
MEIRLAEITVREIANGYLDSAENGVVAYGGKLNVRPAFQREFVYKDKQRDAVIETIQKGFPLNVMYWVESSDGSFELLDGQQRTISFCQYVSGEYSVGHKKFGNLTEAEKEQILNYKLMIYICRGNDREKLDWFKIINIAGEKLTNQELRNAIYTGKWLSNAKQYFSKNACPAYQIASKYLRGTAIRQDYLETALKWISERDGGEIEDYMSEHQQDTNASELWLYFQSVISWVQTVFPKYRKEMQGLEWGILYNKYGKNPQDPTALESRIYELMQDDDITKRSGIYEYLLSGEEKHLNIRSFTDNEKRKMYEKQKGICPHCKKEKREKMHWELEEMEADHITPWCEGGKTEISNGQLLCREHNRRKSNK